MGVIDSAANRISRAFGNSFATAQGMDVPGPPLHVSPFRPGEVSGEAVAVKTIAALMAGRRGAANQRAINDARLLRQAHEQALTEQLQAKLNPPRTVHTLPSGEAIPVTDEQYLSHYSAFHPRPAAGARVHMTADEAKGLNVPFDPETGTAAGADVGFRLREKTAGDVERRFQQSQKATQGRFDTSQQGIAGRAAAQREQTSWTKLIGDLDKNEQEVEQDALARHLGYGAAMQRILQDPNQSITLRAKAARALGVGYARGADGNYLRDPNTQQPLYDLTGLEQRVKDYAQRNAQRARASVASLHAADRLYYSQRLHEATGRFTGQAAQEAAKPAPDIGIDFTPEEQQYLRGLGIPLPGTELGPAEQEPAQDEQPADSDTTWYDKPSE